MQKRKKNSVQVVRTTGNNNHALKPHRRPPTADEHKTPKTHSQSSSKVGGELSRRLPEARAELVRRWFEVSFSGPALDESRASGQCEEQRVRRAAAGRYMYVVYGCP
jgi:hypothetical protein